MKWPNILNFKEIHHKGIRAIETKTHPNETVFELVYSNNSNETSDSDIYSLIEITFLKDSDLNTSANYTDFLLEPKAMSKNPFFNIMPSSSLIKGELKNNVFIKPLKLFLKFKINLRKKFK